MTETEDFLARCIAAGAGREPADLVVKDIAILDVITGSVERSDVAIVGDRIVGTQAAYEGRETIDGAGLFCTAVFIAAHVHF